MANQPDQSLFMLSPASAASASASSSGGCSASAPPFNWSSLSIDQLIELIGDYPSYREQAIHALSKIRDDSGYLAQALWQSPPVITILLQEVIGASNSLSPLKLGQKDIERVCDILALFAFVASNKETRKPFLEAKIPVYVYPFLEAIGTSQLTESLRLTSLSVIVSLVQDDDPDAVEFLLETEVFPRCLHCLEHGSETSNILAARIIAKILAYKEGISFICDSLSQVLAVAVVMGRVVDRIDETSPSSVLLLQHIISCYFCLSKEHRVCCLLKRHFPAKLRSDPILDMLLARGDPEVCKMLEAVFLNIVNACMVGQT